MCKRPPACEQGRGAEANTRREEGKEGKYVDITNIPMEPSSQFMMLF